MIVDEKSVTKTTNANPTAYKNVKVWVAQGKEYPASDARIRAFEYEEKGKYEASKLDKN